jgi:tetratricopeptide (TPR) repeat protein
VAGAKLFKSGEAPAEDDDAMDALDLVGVGRILETAGEVERSIALFQRALAGGLPAGIEVALKEKIGFHFKRAKDYDRALPLWQDLSEKDWTVHTEREIKGILNGLRQLAIHHERHTRDLTEAVRVTEEGLTLAGRVSGRLKDDFQGRLKRLQAKQARR